MKKIFIFPILFGCITSYGQLTLKRADKYYADFDFDKAAYYYKAFTHDKDDAYSQLQLAKIYTFVNDPIETERWYREVINRNDLEPVHYLNYAQALSALGRYQEALPYYEKYKELAPDKLLAEEKTYGISHIEDFFSDSASVKVKTVKFNSSETDFAPSFYQNSIVFSSGRSNVFGLQRKVGWNNKNFLDLYVADSAGQISKFDKHINSKFHEGSTTFSPDGKTMYFTRSNYNHGHLGRSKKGVNMIKLYSASLDAHGKWSNIQEFKYNSDNYSTGDPSLSADGSVLYFVSDMPGGFGGTDLYKSVWTGTEWGTPVNLGHKVNTESNERTPFLTPDMQLYFASDGHFGLGGLDIFAAEAHEGVYDEVRNLGYPINSSHDDFGFIFEPESRTAYFSSERENGQGGDDIYWAYLEEQPKIKLNGQTFWRTPNESLGNRKDLGNSTIVIKNLNTGSIEKLTTNELGAFKADLKQGTKYEIFAYNDTLTPSVASINLMRKGIKTLQPIEFVLVQKMPATMQVFGKIVDSETGKGIAGTPVFIQNVSTKEVIKAITDGSGGFDAELDPNTEYLVKSNASNYLVNCSSFTTPDASTDIQRLTNPIKLSKLALNTKLEVENLYYDLGKFDITEQSAKELDKVVQFMKDNSGITVELGAHTDSRGSATSNTSLSAKRAQSARDYIVSQGVPSTQITFKGYGESQLLNKCKDGITCTDELHAANRRTEIKITGIDKSKSSSESELTAENAFDASHSVANCKSISVVKN